MDKPPKRNRSAVATRPATGPLPDYFTSANFKLPRVGCVQYLNAKPLCHTLGDEVVYGHPVDIARQLRDHELDVANVPIMEALENPAYQIVDGCGVTSRGPVYSVILVHRKPFAEIKSIALDPASKTSAALIRVLMRKMLRHPVEFLPTDAPADAHLWIGDQAMAYRKAHPDEEVLDLGAAWYQVTKLPFVFAVWAMHPKVGNRSIAEALRDAAERGKAARADIARNDEEYHYLTKNVRYEIGSDEKRGIAMFSKLLLECGLIPALPKLQWI